MILENIISRSGFEEIMPLNLPAPIPSSCECINLDFKKIKFLLVNYNTVARRIGLCYAGIVKWTFTEIALLVSSISI